MPDCTNKPWNLFPPQGFDCLCSDTTLGSWLRKAWAYVTARQGPPPAALSHHTQRRRAEPWQGQGWGPTAAPGPLAMATALRPNWRPQRVKQGQRRPLPAQGRGPWWGLCCFSLLPRGFPCHLRAGPGQGPQAPWSCQSPSGCVYRVPAQLQTGMLVYLEQQIFLLTAVGARLSRREDRAQMWSTNALNLKCYFSLLGGKF